MYMDKSYFDDTEAPNTALLFLRKNSHAEAAG